MSDKVLVGHSDAAWFNHPNVKHPRKYHVISEATGRPYCGQLMVADTIVHPRQVDPSMRCQRKACLSRWPS